MRPSRLLAALSLAAALPACTWLADQLVKCDPAKCAADVPNGRCWEDVCIPTFEPTPTPPPSPTPEPPPPSPPVEPPLPPPSTPPPSPSPTPTPTPEPLPSPGEPVVDPVTGNYVTDASVAKLPQDGGVCPTFMRAQPAWVGVVFTNEVPVRCGNCLGKRYNFDATPHAVPPYCYHSTLGGTVRVNRCEQAPACIDTRGPDFWMYHESWRGPQPCDRHSSNPYKCHHVPRTNQAGLTEVCAVPRGDDPRSGRGRCVIKNVQP